MPTVTKTIGTSGRDYSTFTSWEADLDNDTPYDAGDDVVGEVYNDSVFDEEFIVNGGGTLGLSSITINVPESEIHDGTEGTGARLVSTTTADTIIQFPTGNTIPKTIMGLEISGPSGGYGGILWRAQASLTLNRMLIYDIVAKPVADKNAIAVYSNPGSGTPADLDLSNSIIYNVDQQRSSAGRIANGIWSQHSTISANLRNVTIVNVFTTTTVADAYGYRAANGDVCTNVIIMDTSDGGAGDAADFVPASADVSYSMSSDTTATGTGSLTSKVSSDQFVSTADGSEDFHLKAGADAIDAGTDLGTTPAGVEIDIDGRDRDAQGDVWDMGAHEFVAAVVASVSQNRRVIGGPLPHMGFPAS